MTNEQESANRARQRLTSLRQLAHGLVTAGDDVDRIFHALVITLADTICDACAIDPTIRPLSITPHRLELPLQSPDREVGTLVVTRDEASYAFDEDDVLAIATCVELTTIAADRTHRLTVERETARAEHERTAGFGQELLGVVAHDLRSPMAAIMMGSERLAEKCPQDSKSRRTADQVGAFARRLSRMIEQVLDMTRLRLGEGLPLNRCRIQLGQLVRSVLEEVGPANPTYRFELVAPEDVVGDWDADRLGQVLAALLRNAVQYGREAGTIVVTVESSNSFAQLSVRNELRGRAIPADTIAAFFEPYRRGLDEDVTGTGLGLDLFIAREIIRRHGGVLNAESTAEATTFRIAVPLHVVDARRATSPTNGRAVAQLSGDSTAEDETAAGAVAGDAVSSCRRR